MAEPAPTPASPSIQRWITTRLGVWLLISAGTFLLLAAWVMQSRFEDVERWAVQRQLERAQRVLDEQSASLESIAADYARWDDTYAFIESGDAAYVASNFVPSTGENLQLDWVLMARPDGSVALSVDFAGESEPLPQLRPTFAAEVIASFPRLAEGTVDLRDSRLLLVDGMPVLVGRSAITDSAVAAPARGTLLFGRQITEGRLAELQGLADVPFTLHPRRGSPLGPTRITAGGSGWRGEIDLRDAPLTLALDVPALLANEQRTTRAMLALGALANALLAILGARIILRRRVTGRLQQFAALAAQYERAPHKPVRWPVRGDDELDRLAGALNGMVAELARHEAQLHQLAHFDSLTRLGNRRRLFGLLETRLAAAREGDARGASLVLIDLDDFKLINDGLGHLAGDVVLSVFADRLLRLLDEGDHAVRLGGDEFAVLLTRRDGADAESLLDPLRESLTAPVAYEARQISLGMSVGIAAMRPEYTPGDWLRDADMAMYHAKRGGKNRIVRFSEPLAEAARRQHRLAGALRVAVAQNELAVWLQPIVDADTGEVRAAEALARWQHAGQWVEPADFIALAEESPLILALGRRVLDTTCAALARLRVHHPALSASINVSVRQLADPGLADDLARALAAHRLPPSALALELTEGQLIVHQDALLEALARLHAQGHEIHLDDFGVGHSSLARLHALPVSTLKIDRSFIAPLHAGGDDRLVRNILALARDLDLQVIAEGVESAAVRDRLLAAGCRRMQGFLFAAPMAEGRLAEWLQARRQASPQDAASG